MSIWVKRLERQNIGWKKTPRLLFLATHRVTGTGLALLLQTTGQNTWNDCFQTLDNKQRWPVISWEKGKKKKWDNPYNCPKFPPRDTFWNKGKGNPSWEWQYCVVEETQTERFRKYEAAKNLWSSKLERREMGWGERKFISLNIDIRKNQSTILVDWASTLGS